MEVVVPDDQLSLAIGKRGQNVRLASKLSGWRLDVTSETNYNRALTEAYDSLLQLDGVGEKTALNLYQAGFKSVEDVAGSTASDLMEVRDIGKEKASKIIDSAFEWTKTAEKKKENDQSQEASDEDSTLLDSEGESMEESESPDAVDHDNTAVDSDEKDNAAGIDANRVQE